MTKTPTPPDAPAPDAVIAETRDWIARAVIGLNLCPFAKPVFDADRIRYVVSAARTPEALLADLAAELETLVSAPSDRIETTLLIHPHVLADFLDYNDFLDIAEAALEELGLSEEVQIASFHPDYQFAGTTRADVTNYTNRSPYPLLHLLREASVADALAAFPDPEQIPERNIETMRRLGAAAKTIVRGQ